MAIFVSLVLGAILTVGLGYSGIAVLRDKNVDRRTKFRMWFIPMIMVVVIVNLYFRYTEGSRSCFRLPGTSFLAQSGFSLGRGELPSVAAAPQEKHGFVFKRLVAVIRARILVPAKLSEVIKTHENRANLVIFTKTTTTLMTIQILFAIFAIAIVVIFFFNRSAAKKYGNEQFDIIHDLNDDSLEIEAYTAEYQTFDSEKLIKLSQSELPESRQKAIAKVLSQRNMVNYTNLGN